MPHVQMQPQNTQNFKKNAFMICLCYSHMFRCSYKNQKTPKKCIHDICLCYPCMFRCCTKGRGSAPLCDFQRTSTNQCSLQLASCRGHHPHMCKNILPTIESKKCKNQPASILDGPAPIVRASPFSRRRQNPSVISAPLCKFRKYSPTDWAQNQSLVSITSFRYSKIHHL